MQKLITPVLLAFLSGNVLLLSAALVSSSAISAPAAHPSPASVSEFLTDPDTGTVTIRVDGRTILEIDSTGITVTGDIRYTGGITDIGDDVPAIASAGDAN